MKRSIVFLFITIACLAAGWGAYQAAAPALPPLSRYFPTGSLLYLQATDFSSLLSDWNDSREKQLWLKTSNYEVFSRSRLFLRLAEANRQFSKAAGVPSDTQLLRQVAGKQSALAIFDIGQLEFLYITRLPSASFMQSTLWQTRAQFESRSAGGVEFFIRRDPESQREVAFAVTRESLLLATREDLMAGALQLMANSGAPSLESESWWTQSIAAAGPASDLRMVLNLDKIVPGPYFRSYWVRRNVAEMKQYSAAVTDLVRSGKEYREERVLLRKARGTPAAPVTEDTSGGVGQTTGPAPGQVAEKDSGPAAVADILRFVPAHSGFYEAKANPTTADCLALLESKLLAPHPSPGVADTSAPQVFLTNGETGSSADLETRIDQPLVTASVPVKGAGALKDLLVKNAVAALLQVQSTEQDKDGVFVRIHSAVALLGQSEWDETAVRSALVDFVGPTFSTSKLGLAWQKNGPYLQLNGLWTLNLAVHGKYLFISDHAELLTAMLANQNQKITLNTAILSAGFDHQSERRNFLRLTRLLDKRPGGAGEGEATENATPDFFSGNIGSLSSALSGLTSETVVVREAGNTIRQTVTYQWAR